MKRCVDIQSNGNKTRIQSDERRLNMKLNKNELKLVEMIKQAENYVKGELELNLSDGGWYAMDYREDLGGALPIEKSEYYLPLITEDEAEIKNIDVRACCDACGIYIVG